MHVVVWWIVLYFTCNYKCKTSCCLGGLESFWQFACIALLWQFAQRLFMCLFVQQDNK